MKKPYFAPTAKAVAMMCGSRLLQHHSVIPFKVEETRYLGDYEEDDEPEPSNSSRYVGDIDEE